MHSRSIAAMAVVVAGGALLGSGLSGFGAASAPDGLTLTYWTSWDEPPAVAALIDDFERESGVTVEAVTLAPAYEAEALSLWDQGERPDVMLFLPDRSWMLALDPTHTLVDLSEEDFADRYLFGADSPGRIDDGLYAAVFGYPEVYGMLYDREGAARYTIPTGLDELYEACGEYYDAGGEGAFIDIGGVGDIRTLSILPSILWADAVSAGIVDEIEAGTASFTDWRIVEAINSLNSGMVRACLNHDDFHTATYDTQLERLMDGTAAMIPQGISAVGDLVERYGQEAVDERVGFFPLSFRDSLASWSARPDTAFLVPVNDDPARQEAALALVRYAVGEGYDRYVAASGMPPVLDGVDVPEGLPVPVREAHEALLAGAAPTIDTILSAPYGDLNQWLYEMLDCCKTPDDVAIAMADTFASMTGG